MGNRVSKGEKLLKRVSNGKNKGSFSGGFKMFPF
jgi:hypothetical protein